MPATVTHACFTKDVFDILPGKISKLLDISCRKVGVILKSVRNVVRKRIHNYYCQ